MSDIPFETASIAAAVRARKLSAVAVARSAIERIAHRNPRLNAFTTVTKERALMKAQAVDARIAAGFDPGPLAGVPFAAKNLFDIKGLPTIAGSKINGANSRATADATAIRRLNAAGAVLMGTLNMDEYAFDFTGQNVHFGPSRNPHDSEHMTGGSSGGSAGAVAGGMVPLALGTDTNGSIRVPASLCGVFGLKPTLGRLSRAGSFPLCANLDTVGPLAASVAGLAAAYDAMQGHDRTDSGRNDHRVQLSAPSLGEGVAGLRIVVAGDYFQRQLDHAAADAVATVADGLQAHATVAIAEADRARAAAFILTACEGANLHYSRLRERAVDFDPATRDRFLAGLLMPAQWYIQAQRFRRWYRSRVLELFRNCDIILAPATPCTAPRLGQRTMRVEGVNMPISRHLGVFTQPISFIGLPVVAVPVPRSGCLPIGVQVIAAPWNETAALRVAAVLEQAGIARCDIA